MYMKMVSLTHRAYSHNVHDDGNLDTQSILKYLKKTLIKVNI